MRGIIGILSKKPAAMQLIDALKRLTYRVSIQPASPTLVNGHIDRRRAEGKITRDLWCLASTRRS